VTEEHSYADKLVPIEFPKNNQLILFNIDVMILRNFDLHAYTAAVVYTQSPEIEHV